MPMPAKSKTLHFVTGTVPQTVSGEAPADDDIPAVSAKRLTPPRMLSEHARQIFRKLASQLEERRSLTRGDRELLTLYALTWDRHRRELEQVELEGTVCKYNRLSSNGEPIVTEKLNIRLAVVERCEKQMISILDRLGLTPLNRSKVKPTKDADEPYAEGTMGWYEEQERKGLLK